MVKRCLRALAARFNTDLVAVDEGMYNASRICKVYGTTARKGDNTEDRPHRVSRILEAPSSLVPVPIELLPSGQVVTRGMAGAMAGSTLAMNEAIERYVALGHVSLAAAVQAASTNPARLLGRKEAVTPAVEAGCPANLALWRWEKDRLGIEAVYIQNRAEAASPGIQGRCA